MEYGAWNHTELYSEALIRKIAENDFICEAKDQNKTNYNSRKERKKCEMLNDVSYRFESPTRHKQNE